MIANPKLSLEFSITSYPYDTGGCRRCGGPLVLDIGPADDPDADRNIVVEEVQACAVCTASKAVRHEPITAEWARRRIAQVRGR